MIKVAKGKGKICDKNGKNRKYAEEQDNDSTYSFQNYDSRQLLMFLYQGWYLHKEKETLFLTSFMANFLLWPVLFVVVVVVVVLFCFFFFTKDFVPLLIFHEQRFFHEQRASICQFCRVRDLNKIWKQHENRPPTQQQRLPRKFPQGIRLGPRL